MMTLAKGEVTPPYRGVHATLTEGLSVIHELTLPMLQERLQEAFSEQPALLGQITLAPPRLALYGRVMTAWEDRPWPDQLSFQLLQDAVCRTLAHPFRYLLFSQEAAFTVTDRLQQPLLYRVFYLHTQQQPSPYFLAPQREDLDPLHHVAAFYEMLGELGADVDWKTLGCRPCQL